MDSSEKVFPRVYIRRSKVVELTSIVLSIFSSTEKFKLLVQKNYGNNFVNNIIKKYEKIGNILTKINYGGFGLLEFLLLNREFDEIKTYMDKIKQMNEIDFFCCFWGNDIDRETVIEILKSDKKLEKFCKEHNYWYGDLKSIQCIMKNREEFLEEFLSCALEFDNSVFDNLMEDTYKAYKEELFQLENKLKINDPLEISQNIMGKKFRRRGPYSEFIFIPTFFLAGKSVRFMSDIQLLLYKMETNDNAETEKMFEVLRVISDGTRFAILKLLTKEPMYGKQIAEHIKLTTPTISHHLDQLKSVGIINEERVKNIKYFSANGNEIEKFLKWMTQNLDISKMPHDK